MFPPPNNLLLILRACLTVSSSRKSPLTVQTLSGIPLGSHGPLGFPYHSLVTNPSPHWTERTGTRYVSVTAISSAPPHGVGKIRVRAKDHCLRCTLALLPADPSGFRLVIASFGNPSLIPQAGSPILARTPCLCFHHPSLDCSGLTLSCDWPVSKLDWEFRKVYVTTVFPASSRTGLGLEQAFRE